MRREADGEEITVDDDDDSGVSDDERELLLRHEASKACSTAAPPRAGARPLPAPPTGMDGKPPVVQPPLQHSAAAACGGSSSAHQSTSAIAAALTKIDAQAKLIATLSSERTAAEHRCVELQRQVSSLTSRVAEASAIVGPAEELAADARRALGLVTALEQRTGHAKKEDGLRSVEGQRRTLREAFRPVIHVGKKPPPPTPPHDDGITTSEERNALVHQIEVLEAALDASQKQCLALKDAVKEASAASSTALQDELSRVQEELEENTASWDAKERELKRLRTLMRFSVLKRENDQLQGQTERAEKLELDLCKSQRRVAEKTYEVERLERQLQRLQMEAHSTKGVAAELIRLRSLEAHCTRIIAAQDVDPVYNPDRSMRPQGASPRSEGGTTTPRTRPPPSLRQLLPSAVLRGGLKRNTDVLPKAAASEASQQATSEIHSENKVPSSAVVVVPKHEPSSSVAALEASSGGVEASSVTLSHDNLRTCGGHKDSQTNVPPSPRWAETQPKSSPRTSQLPSSSSRPRHIDQRCCDPTASARETPSSADHRRPGERFAGAAARMARYLATQAEGRDARERPWRRDDHSFHQPQVHSPSGTSGGVRGPLAAVACQAAASVCRPSPSSATTAPVSQPGPAAAPSEGMLRRQLDDLRARGSRPPPAADGGYSAGATSKISALHRGQPTGAVRPASAPSHRRPVSATTRRPTRDFVI